MLKARETSEKQARGKARETMLAEAEQNAQRLASQVSLLRVACSACSTVLQLDHRLRFIAARVC